MEKMSNVCFNMSMNGKKRERLMPPSYKASGERFEVATTTTFQSDKNKKSRFKIMASATSVT
ncbi:hypothetical protein MACH16_03290 [Marinomonas pontica]|uniref:Uncharacterized protein n=1 Tax=Marinomonas pontica TaxID=264739 RepID=A0ABM8F9E8_9GAMM|nr:hypothetical protein MACH16_03290 [Marinomonas pontica]